MIWSRFQNFTAPQNTGNELVVGYMAKLKLQNHG